MDTNTNSKLQKLKDEISLYDKKIAELKQSITFDEVIKQVVQLSKELLDSPSVTDIKETLEVIKTLHTFNSQMIKE